MGIYRSISKSKKTLAVAVPIFICILLTLSFDYWESRFQRYSYYFSESFLFSSFWWLFIPFWILQFRFAKNENVLLWILGPILGHAFAYPTLIWLISAVFFPQAFQYWQSFQYGVLEYYFALLALYSLPIGFFLFWEKRKQLNIDSPVVAYPASLVVKEGESYVHIDTRQIAYLSANPPYTNIHVGEKKYLLSETLKSLSDKLDPNFFLRIHKSTIVNLTFVKSHQSRQNGDYDVSLKDGTMLRLSRNYVRGFKSKLETTPQDTAS